MPTESSSSDSPPFPLHLGSSWLELDTVSFSRAQFWAQQGYFEGISGLSEKRQNLRKCLTEEALGVLEVVGNIHKQGNMQ